MNIYLAIAIDNNSSSEDMYEAVSKGLLAYWPIETEPLVIFKPGLAYTVGNGKEVSQEDARYLVNINSYALDAADVMVVAYRPGESWGVPQEIFMAYIMEKPIFVLTDFSYSALPIYLRSWVPKSNVFLTLPEMVKAIGETHNA